VPEPEALITGSASAVQALRCACAIATELEADVPHWWSGAARLAHAVRSHPELFADRARYSMDWYYPVLAGAVRGPAAEHRLAEGWARFVEPGRGVRCVSDQPWFTVAESCELVLALHAVGDVERARDVFADVQHLRDGDGAYWTGYVPTDNNAIWPQERTTWTAAAVVLAADALTEASPASALFRDNGPEGGAAARSAGTGTWLEIGTYCGKSTLLLGDAARSVGARLITVDHHHGSEENQAGWPWHDTSLVDSDSNRLDTLPTFRRVLDDHLADVVTAVIAPTQLVATWWTTPLRLLFLDGNHTEAVAAHDYAAFAPHLQSGGLLLVHDVFPDPADGGQAPWHVVQTALASGRFEPAAEHGSLRVLRAR
jgi:MMP 1-O-methyltransferase